MSRVARRRQQLRSGVAPDVVFANEITTRPIDDLLPYAMNARIHSNAQIAQIAASIKEFGFTNPCLIDENNEIIAGHGRVLAAQQLGIMTIPCVVLPHLTPEQRRAYRLADNKLTLNAAWNDELLGQELDALNDANFDIDVIGFEDPELISLWGEEGGSLGAGGDAPSQTTPDTWAVIVECENEEQQTELIERLQNEGYTVRGSIG